MIYFVAFADLEIIETNLAANFTSKLDPSTPVFSETIEQALAPWSPQEFVIVRRLNHVFIKSLLENGVLWGSEPPKVSLCARAAEGWIVLRAQSIEEARRKAELFAALH